MVREAHFRLNKRHEDGTLSRSTVIYGLLRSEYSVSKA